MALGCGTAHIYPSGPLDELAGSRPGGRASVANPELSEELAILETSGVYELVPAGHGDPVIRLEPRFTIGVCGNPILLTIVTFGLIPATVPYGSIFTYTVEAPDGTVDAHVFRLSGETRISPFQYVMGLFHSDTEALGRMLASEYAGGRELAPLSQGD